MGRRWVVFPNYVLWAIPEARVQTAAAILSFLDDTPPPFPNRPTHDRRKLFIEEGC
ncbi:MAG: hypothetical protein ACNA78_01940 [Balneolaceae bacterium]